METRVNMCVQKCRVTAPASNQVQQIFLLDKSTCKVGFKLCWAPATPEDEEGTEVNWGGAVEKEGMKWGGR